MVLMKLALEDAFGEVVRWADTVLAMGKGWS